MKTVSVSPHAKTVQDLLRQARPEGLILQGTDGQQYMLAPLKNWVGFELGESDDFATEIQQTVQNEKLMSHLARRRSHAKRVPLVEVKKQLGLGMDP